MSWWKVVLVGMVGGLIAVSPASASPEPPAPLPDIEFGTDPSALVQIPAGCPTPEPAEVAFVGTVLGKDEFVQKGTVRFQIDQVRAGTAAPFSVNGLIDVRYGPDSQYLDVGAQYLVSAAVDSAIGALASKVSPDSPLFGGDAVVGLEDTEVECPVVDDPIQTINLDGTPVSSGLLTPLFADRQLLLATLAVPAAIVGAVLVGLVLLRRAFDIGFRGIFALGRAAVVPSGDHRAARVRRHLTPDEAADEGLLDEPVEAAEADVDSAANDSGLVEA